MSESAATSTDTGDNGQGQAPETFSREYVQDLRNEAARYRNEKKDAVDAAKTEARAEAIREYEEKVAEKDTALNELQTTLSDREIELAKIKAVLAAEIPTGRVLDVVSLVQGTDEDTISESVKRVKDLLGSTAPANQPPVDHSQGSGGNVPPLNGDPVLNILEQAVGAKPRRR